MSNTHLENLRNAILKLDPTGKDGFEGLMAALLTEVTGQPFRLASSGAQRGRDGDSALDQGATYFEAKRYDGKVPKERIAVKLMEIFADDQGLVDTFIVGSTSPISAQDASEFNKFSESNGIGVVLLDWTANTPLPSLATLVAMGGSVAKDFLSAQLNRPDDANLLSEALTAIDELAKLPEFNAHSERLCAEISNPSVGLGLAKAANHKWLTQLFSTQELARQQLGQPLAPHDPSMDFLQPRTHLCEDLQGAFGGQCSKSVFVVIGSEGTGKSWLVANTWMQRDPRSILVIAPAGELRDPEDITDIEGFLIKKLIGQTGDVPNDIKERRWRRRIEGWKANLEPPSVRTTLCIDGLNQNPRFRWSHLIDGAAAFLDQIGGQLVITTRSNHFESISQTIFSDVTPIVVPEWTKSELDGILRSRSIEPDVVDREVFETLKNPRILSIAINLLNAREIENIDQLSVGRLLFEHLRNSSLTGSSNLSGSEFAKTLSELASEYVARVESGTEDDLTLFDIRDHSRLKDVSSGSFFKPVVGDPDRYQIVNKGLLLSLGIWLVDALERESRNDRDPFERLETVMEPVAGLDFTAEIVCTATEVACLSVSCSVNVKVALIRHYVGLQNLPEQKRDSFGALVKNSPDAFLEAAKDTALYDERVPTSDWLNVAILEARGDTRVRSAIEQTIPEWLSYYCLVPNRWMYVSARDSSSEEIEAERVRVVGDLENRLEELTEPEKRYIETNLTKLEEGDVDRLHRLAMFFLAGLPLKNFVGPLVSSAFSASLAPTIDVPRRELEHLVRFNLVDWVATREAMLEWTKIIGDERSSVGNWTVAKTLRSTGDPSDAAEVQRLAETLTTTFEKIPSWRLIETYCATDPCNPQSSRPENISDTAEKYKSIAVAQVCAMMGNGGETLFFREAMPGVARFEPRAGIHAIRELAKHALTRQGVARKLAMLTLLPYSVLLDRPEVDALITLAQSSCGNSRSEFVSDKWVSAQYALFIALPHLSANEQLKALKGMHTESLMIGLLDTTRPAKAGVIESLLSAAYGEGDAHALTRLMATLRHTKAPLTDKATGIIADLLEFPDSTVRAAAIAIASVSKCKFLLARFVDSNWNAGRLTSNDHHFELWYGSATLVEAVSAGTIDVEEALDRMAFSHYGIAACRLGSRAAKLVACRVEIALGNALDLSDLTDLPEMEQSVPDAGSSLPPLISLREQLSSSASRSPLGHLGESDEQFHERQRLLHRAYQRFSERITNSEAHLVLNDLTTEGMAAVVSLCPDVIDRWHGLLVSSSDIQKRSTYYFAIKFAAALAEKYTDLAVSVFAAYSRVKPLVSRVNGMARVSIEAEVLWSQGGVTEISELCMERLDNCTNDREISSDVLAAFAHNQEHVLASYVDRLLSTGEPQHIARALTVAGYSDESNFARDALARFDGAKGFVGDVQRAARDSYDRNSWSRHWYERMRAATTQMDFWRYSVLLSRIVDGRITLWGRFSLTEETFRAFIPTIKKSVEQRVELWNGKRKKTLFGDRVPHAVFLIRDRVV